MTTPNEGRDQGVLQEPGPMTGGTGNAHKGSSDGGTWWDTKMVGQGERDFGSRELTQYIERADRLDFGLRITALIMGAPACAIYHTYNSNLTVQMHV